MKSLAATLAVVQTVCSGGIMAAVGLGYVAHGMASALELAAPDAWAVGVAALWIAQTAVGVYVLVERLGRAEALADGTGGLQVPTTADQLAKAHAAAELMASVESRPLVIA